MLYTMPQIFSSVLLEYSKSVYNVDIWKLGCGLTFIISRLKYYGEFPRWFRGKKNLGGEDPLEKKMATHSSVYARKNAWTEESGGLQHMG